MSVQMILMVIAVICFFLAAIPLPFQNTVQLGWLGLFFWALTKVIGSH